MLFLLVIISFVKPGEFKTQQLGPFSETVCQQMAAELRANPGPAIMAFDCEPVTSKALELKKEASSQVTPVVEPTPNAGGSIPNPSPAVVSPEVTPIPVAAPTTKAVQ